MGSSLRWGPCHLSLIHIFTMDIKHFKQQLLVNMLKLKAHDHLTGKYRGAAHSYCNLNYQNPTFLAIYIHISQIPLTDSCLLYTSRCV